MKNILISFALAGILLLGGCQTRNIENDTISNIPSQAETAGSEDAVISIPIDSIEGSTGDEALKLCQKILGVKDNESFMLKLAEEHTGRNIGYRCDGAVESNGVDYYIVCMLWSEDEDVLYSTIGYVGVSAAGDEIYEVFEHSDGSYSFGELLWNG